MALFTRTAKLDFGAHCARCAWAMAVLHAVGISRQRNSGYRPSRVHIMAWGLSTPDPSLSPTLFSLRRGCATTTHYSHHQVSLVVSRNTTLVPYLGLRIGPACKAGLSAGMRRDRVSPQIRKKKKGTYYGVCHTASSSVTLPTYVDITSRMPWWPAAAVLYYWLAEVFCDHPTALQSALSWSSTLNGAVGAVPQGPCISTFGTC